MPTGKSGRANRTRPVPLRRGRSCAASSDAGSWSETRRQPLVQAPPPDGAADEEARPPSADADLQVPQASGRDWVRSLQLLKFEAGGLLHVLPRDLADGLRECPVMAFEISRDVGAIAVELVGGLHQDPRACLPGPGAMLIDPACKAHVDSLRILSAERGRAAGPVRPFASDHDHALAVGHFGMRDIPVS